MKDQSVRIIPVILIKDGNVVQSYGFSEHPIIGQPKYTLKRMLDYQADEVVILDISSRNLSLSEKISRVDIEHQSSHEIGLKSVLSENAGWLCYPLAVGGGIKTIEQAQELVSLGADKVVLNSALRDNTRLIEQCAEYLGSQALVVSIDLIELQDGFQLFDYRSNSAIGNADALLRHMEEAQELGCGELLINNVSRDGKRNGFNLAILETLVTHSSVPLIVAGGAGAHSHFKDVSLSGVSGVAASNFFHSHELSYPKLKKEFHGDSTVRPFVFPRRYQVREKTNSKFFPRDFVKWRIQRAEMLSRNYELYFQGARRVFERCASCLYPIHSATAISFDSRKICSGCSRAREVQSLKQAGTLGESALKKILRDGLKARKTGSYDCVIAVSGGKDSYFQTHYVKNVLGLNPLLVTYDANNWTPTGRRNMERMSKVFSVDHEIVVPPVDILSKMNLLGLIIMGDMSWHAHVGIITAPMRVAAERGIPFVFYGEHGREDLAGQFRYGDFPEVTFRERIEHHARGYEWNCFNGLFGLTEHELNFWAYPSDMELFKSGVRGLHLGSFVKWDPHKQTDLMQKTYGFQTSPVVFDRTYRVGSNLDDMHENGVHDWLKYIKFGYGRATDHGSKDIRLGLKSRHEMLPLVRMYDSTLPNDLQRWLEYTSISKDLFFLISNSFRSPSIWGHCDGLWYHPEGMIDEWSPSTSTSVFEELEGVEALLLGS